MVKIGYRLARGVASGGMTRDMNPMITKFANEVRDNDLLPLCTQLVKSKIAGRIKDTDFYYVIGIGLGGHIVGYKSSWLLPNNVAGNIKKLNEYATASRSLRSTFSAYLNENKARLCKKETMELLTDGAKIALPVYVVKDECIEEVDAAWSSLSQFFDKQGEGAQ